MPKLKLGLLITACFLITTGCSLLSTVANSLIPSPTATLLPTDSSTPTETSRTVGKVLKPTRTPTTNPEKNPKDPLGIFKQVPDKLDAIKSYRITGTVTGGTDPIQDGAVLMEVIAPDRLHLVLPSFEFYSIGTTSYYKFGASATWMKGGQILTGRNPLGVAVLDPRLMIATVAKSQGVNLGQPGTLNGKPMLLFNFTATASDPNSSTGTLWVGQNDELPYRLIDVEQDGTNVELDYSDYNGNFKIDPPIP